MNIFNIGKKHICLSNDSKFTSKVLWSDEIYDMWVMCFAVCINDTKKSDDILCLSEQEPYL